MKTIALDVKYRAIMKNRGMNGSVLAQRPFSFKPASFTSNIEGLKPKLFSQKQQVDWFNEFLENPFEPKAYCVVSAPNDGQAKLLAAYMMEYAVRKSPSATALPMWHDLTGGFTNTLFNERNRPSQNVSLLVLNNVGASSTQPKLEKLRDILEVYSSIPRIVIATGCDPFVFFTKFLYLPIHSLAYLPNGLVKKSVIS
jgi:hypothetical protein